MLARILSTKALAAAIESQKPGFGERLADMFDQEGRGRPFLEIMRAIWGINLDAKSGIISRWSGPNFGYVFKGNVIKTPDGATVEDTLREAWETLRSNDQDPKTRGRARLYNMIGFMMDAVGALGVTRRR